MTTVWQFARFGLDALERHHRAHPSPGPGQVLLRVDAVSLNYRDVLMVRGQYDPRVSRPLVPCSDAVGTVEAVGEGVDLRIGSRHLPIFAQGWLAGPPQAGHLRSTLGGPLPGTLASHILVDASATVPVPDSLSSQQAACLPCAAVTALHALEAANVGPGSKVLTLGTGGVSLFALQLARSLGAEVAVTSSSDARLERCKKLGATIGVNYVDDPSWGRTVARWAGDGVDAVIEVGGTGTMAQSLRATRVGGCISLIGVLAGGVGEVPLVHALMRSIRIQGIFVGSREHTQRTVERVATSDIRCPIAAVVPFDEAPAAFELLAAGGQFGKVVVEGPR